MSVKKLHSKTLIWRKFTTKSIANSEHVFCAIFSAQSVQCVVSYYKCPRHTTGGVVTHSIQLVDTPKIAQGHQSGWKKGFFCFNYRFSGVLVPGKIFPISWDSFWLVYVTTVWRGKATTVGRWSIGHHETLLVVSFSQLARRVSPFDNKSNPLLIFHWTDK